MKGVLSTTKVFARSSLGLATETGLEAPGAQPHLENENWSSQGTEVLKLMHLFPSLYIKVVARLLFPTTVHNRRHLTKLIC